MISLIFGKLRNPLLLVGFAFVLTACDINAVPKFDEQVNAAWSQVENQYQRRADLVPNLVATVQGFATQEREVLQMWWKPGPRSARCKSPRISFKILML